MNYVMLAVVGAATLALMLLLFGHSKRAVTVTFFALCVACSVALFIIYPATAYTLYQQSASVRPQSHTRLQQTAEHTAVVTQKSQTSSTDTKKRQLHIQALMIYSAILLQFVLATMISSVGIVLFKQRWMVYIYFLNHIGNPVIYYSFVPKFREGVKEGVLALWRKKERGEIEWNIAE